MKKQILALMIAVLSVFTTACGNADVEEMDETVVTAVEDETVDAEAEKEWQNEEDAAEVVEEDTTEAESEEETVVEDTTEEVTDEAVAEGSYYPGVYTETGYESEYLGFRYTTPEGFTIASEEEMDEMSAAGEELLSEDFTELQMAYAEIVTINELMVSDEYGVVNFNITLEKTPIDLETYLEIFKEQLSGLSAMAVEIVNEEEVELAGATYTKLTAKVESQGIVMGQEYYLRKLDDRMMALVTTWLDGMEAEKETMMNGFAAY